MPFFYEIIINKNSQYHNEIYFKPKNMVYYMLYLVLLRYIK